MIIAPGLSSGVSYVRCPLPYENCPNPSDPTTLLMNVPFTGVQFAVYESAKRVLVANNVLSSPDEEGLLEQLVAGGAAGGLAAAVTNPLARAWVCLRSVPGEGRAEGAATPEVGAALTLTSRCCAQDIAKTRLQTAGVWEPLRTANKGACGSDALHLHLSALASATAACSRGRCV